MKRSALKKFAWAGVLLAAFVLFTIAVAAVDVQPIGPAGSAVGFATVNGFMFDRIGVHLVWHQITNWLGVTALCPVFVFAMMGLYQLIRRNDIRKVDRRLIALGAFYALLTVCYLLFEVIEINCRPIILNKELEASYPSSHVMLVICVVVTAAMQLRSLLPGRKQLRRAVGMIAWVISAVTVVGRMLSGVHWFTDIVGGVLASTAMIALYCGAVDLLDPALHPGE